MSPVMTLRSPRPLLGSDFPLPVDAPFTRAQAARAGVGGKQLHRLVNEGLLRRQLAGVYVAAQVPDSIGLRCRALSLVVPEDCFVCDLTAAWVHAGPKAVAPNEHLAVPPVSCFRPSDAGRLRNAVTLSGERDVSDHDLVVIDGLRVTSPLRTALDLGRLQRSRDMRMWDIDCMLGLGRFGLDELLAEIPRFRGQRGVVGLRALAPLGDSGTASFGEAALKLRWYDAGLPRPRTQVPIVHDGRLLFALDLGLEELLFAAEFDGEQWHSSPEQADADTARREWIAENRRWAIEVFTKANVWGHDQDADRRLARAFLAARASLGRRTFIL